MKKLLHLLFLLQVGFLGAQQTTYTIDFNDYAPGNLHGQDGWVTFKEWQGNNDFEIGEAPGGLASGDGSQAMVYFHSGPGVGRVATRKPSSNFDFSFTGGGLRSFEFDMHSCWWGTWVCIGFDKNGNGKMTPNQENIEPSEGGLILSLGGSGFPNSANIKLPNGDVEGYTIASALVDKWVRMRLTIDLDANGGSGSASLSLKEDLALDWAPVPGAQDLNLQLTPGSGDKNDPEVWDAISFQVQGASGGFDNLVFTKPSDAFQYLSFTQIPDKLTTDQPFQVFATSSSGLPVSYSIVSGPATVSGDIVTLTGQKGFVTVRASQPGDGSFDPAADVDVAFEVVDPSEFPPILDIRTPVDGATVHVPGSLSPILLSAYSYVEHADVLSVQNVDFIIGNETVPARDWGNGHYTAWWQPTGYQQFSMSAKAYNSEGYPTTVVSNFEVVNAATNLATTTFDRTHLLAGNGVKDTFYVLPAHVGAYDQIIGKLNITCPPGGCDPWDRISSIKVKSHEGVWVEIIRYLTPYGVPCDHEIDLTDFFPILQGKVQMRAELGTFANGFEYTLDLEYRAGTPAHKYGKVDVLWKGGYHFGDMANLQPCETFSIQYPSNAVASRLKLVSTGHSWGDNNTGNAAEFHEDTHHIRINGQNAFEQHNWWNCNPNPQGCQPQNGTWYFNRAGWCPGTIAQWFNFDMTPHINTASPIEVKYIFDEAYKDLCSTANPNCVSGITCPNCEDPASPILEVWANLVTFSDTPNDGILNDNKEAYLSEKAVTISPNPNHGRFEIRFSQNIQPALLTVQNAAGQPVFSKRLNTQVPGDRLEIDLGSTPGGVYFVVLRNEAGVLTKRLVVH